MSPDDPVAQDRTYGAVYVADGHLDSSFLPFINAFGGLIDDLPVQVVLERVCLWMHLPNGLTADSTRLGEDKREVQALAFPVVNSFTATEPVDLANHVVEPLEA